MKSILQNFQKKLTNLNSNNKSLLALRTFDSDVDLHRFDFAKNEKSFSIIEQLLLQKNTITLCDYDDARNETINELSKKVKKVHRINQIIFEERGTKDLYVGWPFVHGMFANGVVVRCPLLFFPVDLSTQANTWVLKPKSDVDIIFNRNFLLAYAHHQGKQLDMSLYEASLLAEPMDSVAFRTHLYELLKGSNIEINFNQDLFQDKLQSFKIFKRNDFESTCEVGVLKLFPEAVLGQFPQAGNFMSPDYDYMIGKEEFVSMEDLFFEKNEVDNDLISIKEEKIFSPFQIDAWQEDALVAAKSGKSIVVQGPPGTGKSQLICNLVSDFISRGKKVLVVCQKRAALEVVHQRLATLQLESFVGVVHDYKNDRRKIFDQLHAQIELVGEYKKNNSTLDSIVLERNFSTISKQIDEAVLKLSAYKKALFDDHLFGKNIKELYLTTDSKVLENIDFGKEYIFFKADVLEETLRKFKQYYSYKDSFKPFEAFLKHKINFKDFTSLDAEKMVRHIGELPTVFEEIIAPLQNFYDQKITHITFQNWVSKADDLDTLISFVKIPSNQDILTHILSHNQEEQEVRDHLQEIKNIWAAEAFAIHGYSKAELLDQQNLIDLALDKFANKILFHLWKGFSKDYKKIKILLQLFKLKPNKNGLQAYKIILHQRLEHLEYLALLSNQFWQFPLTNDQEEIENYFKIYTAYITTLKSLQALPCIDDEKIKDLNKTAQILVELNNAKQNWAQQKSIFLQYISVTHISQILNNEIENHALQSMVADQFESLVAYDNLFESFSKQEHAILSKLKKFDSQYSSDVLLKFVQNRIQQHWIAHIEMLFPILKISTNKILQLLETQLQEGIVEKNQLCQNIVQMRVRELTYYGLQYNRLNNQITYRDLKHQVGKKKNLWSLRQVMQAHTDEVLKLIPCWLASPESVSAIFPIEQKFDLVIFDEASQCYAEQAIPSIYRAKQVVIAGDAMQLAPSDLYQVRWENFEEEIPDLEVNSLLSLAERYLEPHLLQGHYRSVSKGLIDFSNKHFYKGKLKFLPHEKAFLSSTPSIDFIKADGLWIQGANVIEAQLVAEIILTTIEKYPNKSLGIISFNFSQSQLIQDYLDGLCKKNNLTLPEDLFIKNIENVQGDERDIILLSIGYAPDQDGRVHAHFGSLNTQGGEHRLNVAITRAREKMLVISSIYHHQLEVQNTLHNGPKLLQKYLEYAQQISENKLQSVTGQIHTKETTRYLKDKLKAILNESQTNILENDFADLTAMNKNRKLHLIFTDDEGYYAASNIKEYHAYKILEAKKKNWSYSYFTSRNYFINRNINDLEHYFL